MRTGIVLLAILAACGGQTNVEAEAGTSSGSANTTTSEASTSSSSSESTSSSSESDSSSSTTGDVMDRGCDEMVLVPAGAFWMGCNEETDSQCLADELPYHEVTLDEFEIDRCEVDSASYEACVLEGVCPYEYLGITQSCWVGSGAAGAAERPANCVPWAGAAAYCAWVGKRLPTEAEWEKAARGADGRVYPWGDQTPTCELAVMNEATGISGCDEGHAATPGSKPEGASPYGALDMSGNIQEWVADDYAADYYGESPATNPSGPEAVKGAPKVARGGPFLADVPSGVLRASSRTGLSETYMGLGFRCVAL